MMPTTNKLFLKAAEEMRNTAETQKKEHENESVQAGGDAGKVV